MSTDLPVDGPHSLIPTSAGIIGVLFLLSYIFNRFLLKSGKPLVRLPPGPKPKPLVGNIFDLPPTGQEVTSYYVEMSKIYGPVLGFKLMGQVMIVITDLSIARELMDKRSSTYSGRPRFVFASEMISLGETFLFAQADSDYRQMRKFIHGQMGSTMAVDKWSQVLDLESRRYLVRMLEQPSDFVANIRDQATTIVLKLVYGYQVDPRGCDELIELIEQVMTDFSDATVPGKWLVDSLPFLRYLPGWLPGTGFKQTAQLYAKRLRRATDIPFQFVKSSMQAGTALDSMVATVLTQGHSGKKLTEHQEKLLKNVAFAMYAGGHDTTAILMEIFFLAMIEYPQVLVKAQAEVDHILGGTRLPNAGDRARLPYCEAVLKEVIRWQHVGEIVMPHANSEDDEYGEYFIPKGSWVVFNLRAHLRNPRIYNEPEKFKPERFLGEDAEPDVLGCAWGFGKRICPGRFLAIANLWLQTSRTIACFNIHAVQGEKPSGKFTNGFSRRPVPFKAVFSVRSTAWTKLIREVETTDPLPAEGDARFLE